MVLSELAGGWEHGEKVLSDIAALTKQRGLVRDFLNLEGEEVQLRGLWCTIHCRKAL